MTTTERSIDEIVNSIPVTYTIETHEEHPYKSEYLDKEDVKRALTTERQNREEVVEALEAIRLLVTDIYEDGKEGDTEEWVDDLLKYIYKLTQPNNTK